MVRKTVYVGLTLDFVHHGHISLLERASELGDVTLGVLAPEAVAEHKRLPILSLEARMAIANSLKWVSKVVVQDTWDYSENIQKYRPDYFVHGDDWDASNSELRSNALAALGEYGGELVELSHTAGINSFELNREQSRYLTTSDVRRGSLRRLLQYKKCVRFMEAHSPISALVVENASFRKNDLMLEFDGFWSSSLTDSTEMGLPDIEALSVSQRLENISHIFDVTTKPLIFDADTGGKVEHLELNIKAIERAGISAIIIEDKVGLKKNSLLGNDVAQQQDDPDNFSYKISRASKARNFDDLMIIARIESLILEKGLDDALMRAGKYVRAGADGIMIHSRTKDGAEVLSFAKRFKNIYPDVPLVAVPSSYSHITDRELADHGFNIVIYANQLLRASYKAMSDTAATILEFQRAQEVDKNIISINQILNLIPGTVK